MTLPPVGHVSSARGLHVLDTALDQSHGVKAKLDDCARELVKANEDAKSRIDQGTTTLPAAQVLAKGIAVEMQVHDVAEDLEAVTDNLADGVDEVKQVEKSLSKSRDALAESEAALLASRHAERAASYRAMHDQRTGLPNRTLFDDRLAQAIAGAERHGWMLAVMFLDLDRFKGINDAHGHEAGDAVLQAVAQRLSRHARDEDTVCRNGGDEFLYLLIDPTGRENVARIAGLVRKSIAAPLRLGELDFAITPSIGIALYPEHGTNGGMLIARADAAMYRAKALGSPCEFWEKPAASARPAAALEAGAESRPSAAHRQPRS